MKLWFRQRLFSWFDSYDIYNEDGSVAYTVEGQFAWGHCLHILDAAGNHIGTVRQQVCSLLPKFELYVGEDYVGSVQKAFTFFFPRYEVDCNGWQVEGDFLEWEYAVKTGCGVPVAAISKEVFRLTDTYCIHVADPADALCALMVVLAIDAEKCSRK